LAKSSSLITLRTVFSTTCNHVYLQVLVRCLLHRILGGIGVVLPWWPIKAYRPCPNFINAGGRYVRTGQPLDEIAFGRDSTYDGGSN